MIIASTDYDWRQAEERTLLECDECSNKQVQLDSKFASLRRYKTLNKIIKESILPKWRTPSLSPVGLHYLHIVDLA